MTRTRVRNLFAAIVAAGMLSISARAQTNELAVVTAKSPSRNIMLPGEVLPFLSVALHARVPGYVEHVLVDRGSVVKEGDLLVQLSAPEMKAQIAEAESKVQAAQSDQLQAEAQLAGFESTLEAMRKAAQTPGAIAGNEITQVEKQVDGVKATIAARKQAVRATQASVEALKAMESYLNVTAPFDGIITDRMVHPGALASAASELLVLQQISRLRLVVAVPEENFGGVVRGATVSFRVPAYPDQTFSGTVARIARVLDPKTRAMPVELDVFNNDQRLGPGMYAAVNWPVRSPLSALFAPKSSVVTTTERTFVIR
jgi:membrane fusion protein (multidrug efflux system)